MDTGTVAVSLSGSLVEQLGLPLDREVRVTRSGGTQIMVGMYQDLTVSIDGRKAVTSGAVGTRTN